MTLTTENSRYVIKTITLILLFAVFILPIKISAQEEKSKIDYSVKSNILDPDTLSNPYQKLVFNYFLKHSSQQLETMSLQKIKQEFDKIGIPEEKQIFGNAASFFLVTMKNHKISCEQWYSFKDLEPPK